MSNLSSLYIKAETLKKMLQVVEAKQMKGVDITISTGDKISTYGQNVTAYVSQSKEDREAKKDKFYVGNGKVFWTDGNAEIIPPRQEQTPAPKPNTADANAVDDLPF
jgi:hypothetical protein